MLPCLRFKEFDFFCGSFIFVMCVGIFIMGIVGVTGQCPVNSGVGASLIGKLQAFLSNQI